MTVVHEPEHSPLGASSAERWMNCPGSNVILAKLKLPESDEEEWRSAGLAAHDAGAACLTEVIDTWEIVGREFHGLKVDDAMAEAVQLYLDTVRPMMTESATVMVEQRVGADPATRLHPKFFGRVDFAAYDTDITEVVDYKHGEGIVVEPEENVQMLYYAYGILEARRSAGVNVRSDRVVRLTIVQPRAWHEDGPVRQWETTAGEVFAWAEETLLPAMRNAEVDVTLDAGKWCRFCPAKLFCPLLAGLFGAAAKADPEVIPNFGQQRLALEYAQRDAVKFYVTALEREIYRRNMLGNTVPGTKLVLKKANRVFKEGAEAVLVEKLGATEVYTKPELKSPAEIDKLGPAAKKIVSELAYMPQTGLTVADASSTKPAVKVEKQVDTFAHLIQAGDNNATQQQ